MVTAEQQLSLSELCLAVFLGTGNDLADIGQSGADALAVDIAQAALDVIFCIEIRVNLIILPAKPGELLDFCLRGIAVPFAHAAYSFL